MIGTFGVAPVATSSDAGSTLAAVSSTMSSASPSSGPSSTTRFTVGPKTKTWLRRFNVADEALERVFDMDGDFELIASPKGNSGRESTVNCYLLCGFRALLKNDEPRFSDGEAVELCKEQGVYDVGNHAHTRSRAFGNRISGSKETGFTLPAPGIEAAANLVKALASK